jgi:predicted transcriptional regulator
MEEQSEVKLRPFDRNVMQQIELHIARFAEGPTARDLANALNTNAKECHYSVVRLEKAGYLRKYTNGQRIALTNKRMFD